MKRLTFTEADKSAIIEEFTRSLQNFRSNQEKFVYEKKFSEIAKIDEETIRKPVIYFSLEAWVKMISLVKTCDKEIAWQATVEKRKFKNKEDSKDFFYYIKQVFVYPQKVTGTFVDTDEIKYAEWSLTLDDETYNSLRFQGHSHVNMSVGPSGTDLNTYQNFLDQLDKDDFYIFMILNKKNEFNIMVYDFAQDILFENKDCYTDVLISQGSLQRWTEENMKQVEHKQELPSWEGSLDYGTSYPYSPMRAQQKPKVDKKSNTLINEKGITFVNEKGYLQRGQWVSFTDIEDLYYFFADNPEFIDEAALSPNLRKEILRVLEPDTTESKKKKGKQPKEIKIK